MMAGLLSGNDTKCVDALCLAVDMNKIKLPKFVEEEVGKAERLSGGKICMGDALDVIREAERLWILITAMIAALAVRALAD